jgi:hypothetical protein
MTSSGLLRWRSVCEGSGARSSPHPGEPRAGAPKAQIPRRREGDMSDGALYRIYRDRSTSSWFADGIYG